MTRDECPRLTYSAIADNPEGGLAGKGRLVRAVGAVGAVGMVGMVGGVGTMGGVGMVDFVKVLGL